MKCEREVKFSRKFLLWEWKKKIYDILKIKVIPKTRHPFYKENKLHN